MARDYTAKSLDNIDLAALRVSGTSGFSQGWDLRGAELMQSWPGCTPLSLAGFICPA